MGEHAPHGDQRMSADALSIVRSWLAATNAGDVERVLALSAPDVLLVGPRGRAQGHDVLRAWLAGAGATFETGRTFALGETVVVAQHAVWHDQGTGAVVGEADVATRFVVHDGRVAQLERHDALADALRAGGLTGADKAPGEAAP